MEIQVQEVVPIGTTTRTDLGRVVIKHPTVMGPLKLREAGCFRMCCNRAFLTQESFQMHQEETTEHGTPLDFNRLPKGEAPAPLEKRTPTPAKEDSSEGNGHLGYPVEEPAHQCDQCAATFSLSSALYRHKRMAHSSAPSYFCDVCNGGFSNPKSLKLHHWAVHLRTGEPNGNQSDKLGTGLDQPNGKTKRTHECSVCKKLLSTPQTLRGHMLIHQNVKPCKCDLCGARFRLQSAIVTHIQASHTGGPFKCNDCTCSFTSEKGLNRHGQLCQFSSLAVSDFENDNAVATESSPDNQVHCQSTPSSATGKLFECDICHMRFGYRSTIYGHKKKSHFHQGEFRCDKCPCRFASSGGLANHKRYCIGYSGAKNQLPQPPANSRELNTAASSTMNGNAVSPVNIGNNHGGKKGLAPPPTTIRISSAVTSQAQKVLKTARQRKTSWAPLTTCGVCGCNFSRKPVLIQHMKAAHSNGRYRCKYCNCSFHHPIGLTKHLTWHETGSTSGKRQKGNGPTKIAILTKRPQMKIAGGGFHCGKCTSTFVSSRALAAHQLFNHSNSGN